MYLEMVLFHGSHWCSSARNQLNSLRSTWCCLHPVWSKSECIACLLYSVDRHSYCVGIMALPWVPQRSSLKFVCTQETSWCQKAWKDFIMTSFLSYDSFPKNLWRLRGNKTSERTFCARLQNYVSCSLHSELLCVVHCLRAQFQTATGLVPLSTSKSALELN
jgi:hypothetical protein